MWMPMQKLCGNYGECMPMKKLCRRNAKCGRTLVEPIKTMWPTKWWYYHNYSIQKQFYNYKYCTKFEWVQVSQPRCNLYSGILSMNSLVEKIIVFTQQNYLTSTLPTMVLSLSTSLLHPRQSISKIPPFTYLVMGRTWVQSIRKSIHACIYHTHQSWGRNLSTK